MMTDLHAPTLHLIRDLQRRLRDQTSDPEDRGLVEADWLLRELAGIEAACSSESGMAVMLMPIEVDTDGTSPFQVDTDRAGPVGIEWVENDMTILELIGAARRGNDHAQALGRLLTAAACTAVAAKVDPESLGAAARDFGYEAGDRLLGVPSDQLN